MIVLKERNYKPRILYSLKISFKNKSRMERGLGDGQKVGRGLRSTDF